jgi:hypothetical protein
MAEPRAVILRPGEGRSIDLGNFQMSVKATAEQTNDAFTLLEADEPPGFGPPQVVFSSDRWAEAVDPVPGPVGSAAVGHGRAGFDAGELAGPT